MSEPREWSLERIKRAPTRLLLSWLDMARKCGGWYSPVDSHSAYGHRSEDLKAELAMREHIPNKLEAKALRRRAARRGR